MADKVFAPPPAPKTALGRHRILSPTAGVRVSPLCLGAMNFGDAWKSVMGECDQKTSEEILDYFYDNGGNFIDTANSYQHEESEIWIGEWMKKRDIRDQIILATKYTTPYRTGNGATEIISNTGGNGTKSMNTSVNQSLKKLQTDYIDILYVHWWDMSTSIPEVMQSLNSLVVSGKVLYLGVSDTPAWVVSKANEYARSHGFRQFSIYQGRWSAEHRDFERDIIPMCQEEGMGFAPWGTLGGGNFKTDEQRKNKDGRNMAPATENAVKVSKVLEKIAERKGTLITSVALAYVMAKVPYVFPIVGGRKVEHLKGNVEALELRLEKSDIQEIEGAIPFDIGFPMTMMGNGVREDNFLMNMGGHFEYVEGPRSLSGPK